MILSSFFALFTNLFISKMASFLLFILGYNRNLFILYDVLIKFNNIDVFLISINPLLVLC